MDYNAYYQTRFRDEPDKVAVLNAVSTDNSLRVLLLKSLYAELMSHNKSYRLSYDSAHFFIHELDEDTYLSELLDTDYFFLAMQDIFDDCVLADLIGYGDFINIDLKNGGLYFSNHSKKNAHYMEVFELKSDGTFDRLSKG